MLARGWHGTENPKACRCNCHHVDTCMWVRVCVVMCADHRSACDPYRCAWLTSAFMKSSLRSLIAAYPFSPGAAPAQTQTRDSDKDTWTCTHTPVIGIYTRHGDTFPPSCSTATRILCGGSQRRLNCAAHVTPAVHMLHQQDFGLSIPSTLLIIHPTQTKNTLLGHLSLLQHP